MRFLAAVLVRIMTAVYFIGICRELSMTFKRFGWAVHLKNDRAAALLIARRNAWKIVTDPEKRKKLSLWGIVSYLMFLPQIIFFVYGCWLYCATGTTEFCAAEKAYLAVAGVYYTIAISIKIKEADRFAKGKLW